jgi:hypothetical protein
LSAWPASDGTFVTRPYYSLSHFWEVTNKMVGEAFTGELISSWPFWYFQYHCCGADKAFSHLWYRASYCVPLGQLSIHKSGIRAYYF